METHKNRREDKPDPRAKAAEKMRKDLEECNKYGGRGDEAPDPAVNPADDLHVHDGEEGEPAETEHHDTQQRGRGKEKNSRVS